jgi:signal transduction histidine kinase
LLASACRLTGAPYAIWLQQEADGWKTGPAFGFDARQRRQLLGSLAEGVTSALDRILASRRPAMAPATLALAKTRARLFPAPAPSSGLLLVGIPPGGLLPDFGILCQAFARVLALTPSVEQAPGLGGLRPALVVDLDGILQTFVRRIPCGAADLAVRSGDRFRVAAARGFAEDWIGAETALAESPLEARLVKRRGPVVIRSITAADQCPVPAGSGLKSWLGVPLVVGERVIGRIGLAARECERFDRIEVELAMGLAHELAPTVEGVLLFQEATRRLGRLAIVNEVASLGSALGRPERIVDRCCAVLRRAFNTPWVSYSESGEGAGAGEVESILADALGGASSLPGVLAGQPKVRRRERDPSERGGWLNHDAMCQMVVPVRFGENLLGALVVESPRQNAFGEDDERLLAVVAGQLGGLLENSRLYREMEVAVRQLSAVRETALDLASQVDHPEVLDNLVERTQSLVGVPAAELGLVDPVEGVVRIAVSRNPWRDYTGTTIRLGEGLEGAVARSGEAMVGEASLWWSGREAGRRRRRGIAACVPLRWGEETIGVLSVVDDSPERSFSAEDLRLLELLAPQAAITLRNAGLVQDLRRQMDERKRTEAQLIQSAKMAAVGQMAAGLAHEINNPLTTVAGFAELWLEEMSKNDPRRAEYELMTREAQRARGVVARLLDFARQRERVRERSDLNDVVSEGIDLVRHLLKLHGVELHETLAEGLPWVDIDRSGVKQILLNLVHNAIQAMPTGGRLLMETRLASSGDRPGVSVSVQDTGSGIPAEHMGRIFEPFFTTKPGGQGTGLGLAVSYAIVAEHNGRITVESEVGKGSRFEIWFPLPETEA